jgi:hypothetical protein
MSNYLPDELQQRCAKIADSEFQGVPLAISDYVLFAVATVLIPAILIAIGALV